MKIAKISISCLALVAAAAAFAEPPTLKVLAEKTPITYRSSDNLGDGQATELVQALLGQADINYNIYFTPWKRAYRRAEKEANILLYPLARTAAREDKFHWLGQITPVHYYLFKLADRRDISAQSFSDLSSYKIGVVNFHAHHLYLMSMGVKNLEQVNSSRQNFNKLLRRHVDLFASSSAGLLTLCEQEKFDCGKLEPVIKLEGISKGLYVAASLRTAPAVVETLRQAYKSLQRSGTVAAIMAERMNYPGDDKFLRAFNQPAAQ